MKESFEIQEKVIFKDITVRQVAFLLPPSERAKLKETVTLNGKQYTILSVHHVKERSTENFDVVILTVVPMSQPAEIHALFWVFIGFVLTLTVQVFVNIISNPLQ
jgi:hypothetical protein